MIGPAPDYTNSEYFESRPVWRLKEGAPRELKEEFERENNTPNCKRMWKFEHPEMKNPYCKWDGEIVDLG